MADPECVICLSSVAWADRVANPACGHVFHRDCIVRWLRQGSTCPVCRAYAEQGSVVWCATGRPVRRVRRRTCATVVVLCLACLSGWLSAMLLTVSFERVGRGWLGVARRAQT